MWLEAWQKARKACYKADPTVPKGKRKMKGLLPTSALLLAACSSSPVAPQEIETQDDRACYMGEPVRVLESYEMTSVVAYDQRQDTIYADTYLLDEAGYCW